MIKSRFFEEAATVSDTHHTSKLNRKLPFCRFWTKLFHLTLSYKFSNFKLKFTALTSNHFNFKLLKFQIFVFKWIRDTNCNFTIYVLRYVLSCCTLFEDICMYYAMYCRVASFLRITVFLSYMVPFLTFSRFMEESQCLT